MSEGWNSRPAKRVTPLLSSDFPDENHCSERYFDNQRNRNTKGWHKTNLQCERNYVRLNHSFVGNFSKNVNTAKNLPEVKVSAKNHYAKPCDSDHKTSQSRNQKPVVFTESSDYERKKYAESRFLSLITYQRTNDASAIASRTIIEIKVIGALCCQARVSETASA